MNKKAIKDYKLFFFVGAVVFLDIIILIMWAFISPFSLSLIELPKIVSILEFSEIFFIFFILQISLNCINY